MGIQWLENKNKKNTKQIINLKNIKKMKSKYQTKSVKSKPDSDHYTVNSTGMSSMHQVNFSALTYFQRGECGVPLMGDGIGLVVGDVCWRGKLNEENK